MGFLLTPRAAAAAGIIVSSILIASLTSPLVNPLGAQAVIRGVLYDDATGAPVRGTVMLVDPASDAAVVHVAADSLGRFELSAARGTYQLAAVREGYTSLLSAPIPLLNGERMTVRVPIARDGQPQHHIGVSEHVRPEQSASSAAAAAQDQLDGMAGYRARRATGTGLHFDRAELVKTNVTTLGEFLLNVSGVRVVDPGSTSSMQMSRSNQLGVGVPRASACHIGWFIDGHRMDLPGQRIDPITDGLGSMPIETIEALEIFRGVSEMPPEFAQPDLRCGAVAIWSRRR